jgi:hypothetical protein
VREGLHLLLRRLELALLRGELLPRRRLLRLRALLRLFSRALTAACAFFSAASAASAFLLFVATGSDFSWASSSFTFASSASTD